MKRKGFTLMELLAVIVVLGVIALIIVPNVIVVVQRSEKDAFEKSAYGILTAAKEYYQEKESEEDFTGKTFNFEESVELELEGRKPTGGTVTVNAEGNVEIYVSDEKYCAIKEMTSNEITVLPLTEVEKCGGEMNPPTVGGFTVKEDSIESSSFTVVGACLDEVGINRYEFYISEVIKDENGNIIENEISEEEIEKSTWFDSKSGIYTFKNLKSNTEYKVRMRCQNNNGIKTKAENELTVKTGSVEVACEVIPSINGWTTEKTVKISYTEKEEYTKQYSRDNGETWRNVEEKETELKFTKPGNVIARIIDGTKKVTTMCNVNKVDSTKPEVNGSILETSGIDKTITVGAYCSDEESGIVKYEYAISETQVTSKDFDKIEKIYETTSNAYKFRDLTENGKYYIYVRCTNGAGDSEVSDVIEATAEDSDRVRCEIDKSGYSNSGKMVTVNYPENYTNSYQVNTNERQNVATVNEKEIENNKSYTTEKLKEDIKVKAPADVYGKIVSSENNSQSTLCSVMGIDMIAPEVEVESKPVEGEWHNKDKEIIITKSDEGGSGVKAYYISKKDEEPKSTSTCMDGHSDDEWICDTASTVTIKRGLSTVPTNGPETYYVWVMDAAGNVSKKETIVIDKIETTNPTCSLRIVEGTKGNNDWYTSDVKVEIVNKDDKKTGDYEASGVGSFGIYSNQSGLKPAAAYTSKDEILTITEDGVNYVYGFVKDKAGNINECGVLVIKKDATKPSCTITGQIIEKDTAGTVVGSYTSGKWTNYFVKTRANGKDKVSKVKSIEFVPGGASGTNKVMHDNEDSNDKNEYYTTKSEGISTITAVVTDYAGNVANCDTIDIKEDHTKPTCNIKVSNGTMGTNDWYTSNVEFVWDNKQDALSGLTSYGIGLKQTFENNTNYELNQNTESSGITVSGYVKDTAGNINACSKTVKRDASAPEISAKSDLVNYTSSDGNKNIIDHGFNLTYGKSGGSYVCTYNGKQVTKVSELGTHHRVSVTCEATSGSGLKSKATTTFRYYYEAQINYYCDSGWSLNGSTCSRGNSGANCGKCGTGYNYATGCNSCTWATGTYQCNCYDQSYQYACGSYSCNCYDQSYQYACGSHSCNCSSYRYSCGSYSCNCSIGCPGNTAACMGSSAPKYNCSTCTRYCTGTRCGSCTSYCTGSKRVCSTCTSYCIGSKRVCSTCTSYESGSSCSHCGSYQYVASTYCHSCSWTDYKNAYYYYSCPSKGSLSGKYCYF